MNEWFIECKKKVRFELVVVSCNARMNDSV